VCVCFFPLSPYLQSPYLQSPVSFLFLAPCTYHVPPALLSPTPPHPTHPLFQQPLFVNPTEAPPDDPEKEKEIVADLEQKTDTELKVGDEYCLIHQHWWNDWCKYVGLDEDNAAMDDGRSMISDATSLSSKSFPIGNTLVDESGRPTKIDNSSLLHPEVHTFVGAPADSIRVTSNAARTFDGGDDTAADTGALPSAKVFNPLEKVFVHATDFLQDRLEEDRDFVLLARSTFEQLQKWYGGGPMIARKVIEVGFEKVLLVEVYPMHLIVHNESKANASKTMHFSMSQVATVSDLYEHVCDRLDVQSSDDIQIWDIRDGKRYAVLSDRSVSLEDAQLLHGQELVVEIRDGATGSFASSVDASAGARTDTEESKSIQLTPLTLEKKTKSGKWRGLTGLDNLGNTCFMSAAIQCLSNTAPLLHFFLSDVYRKDINKKNPIGMKGQLATEFASLMQQLWAGKRSISPRRFRWVLGKYAPRFTGYRQQDSQELLAFLLDGLHEDLNRIMNKPTTTQPDAALPHAMLAQESWAQHQRRNDSVIVDWMQGQLRSIVVCPTCDKKSVIFDPFLYLSLPLSRDRMRSFEVTLVRADGTKAHERFTLRASAKQYVRDLTNQLAEQCNISARYLKLGEVFHHQVDRYFNRANPLQRIRASDVLYAYELDLFDGKKQTYVPHINATGDSRPCYVTTYFELDGTEGYFGEPLLLSFPSSRIKYVDLYVAILTKLQRRLRSSASNNSSAPNIRLTARHAAFSKMVNRTVSALADKASGKMSKLAKLNLHPMFRVYQYNRDRTMSPLVPIRAEAENIEVDLSSGMPLVTLFQPAIFSRFYDESRAKKDVIEHKSEESASSGITLASCMRQFTSEEVLGRTDQWVCPSCREAKRASKKFDVWKCPPILAIHLKRFAFDNHYRQKLSQYVDFPLRGLDMKPHLKQYYAATSDAKLPSQPDPVYDLYGVVNHMGSSYGGHYIAYAKHPYNDTWYEYDDSHVTPIREEDVRSKSAYVLFYKRRDVQTDTA
jgi:ubiquitin C-terminal hydrolase